MAKVRKVVVPPEWIQALEAKLNEALLMLVDIANRIRWEREAREKRSNAARKAHKTRQAKVSATIATGPFTNCRVEVERSTEAEGYLHFDGGAKP